MDQVEMLELWTLLNRKSTLLLDICEQIEMVRNLELKSYDRARHGSEFRTQYDLSKHALQDLRTELRVIDARASELIESFRTRLAA